MFRHSNTVGGRVTAKARSTRQVPPHAGVPARQRQSHSGSGGEPVGRGKPAEHRDHPVFRPRLADASLFAPEAISRRTHPGLRPLAMPIFGSNTPVLRS